MSQPPTPRDEEEDKEDAPKMESAMRERLKKGPDNIWTDHKKMTASPMSFRSRPSSAPSKRSTVASQAPQRARVALQEPFSRRLSPDRGRKPGKWKPPAEEIDEWSVPLLLDLLTPAIVWSHPKKRRGSGSVSGRYRDRSPTRSMTPQHTHRDGFNESHYCEKQFFNGHIDQETEVHGVYEGTYWDLLADLKGLRGFLSERAKEPELEDVGDFVEPAAPESPAFKAPLQRPDPPQPEKYQPKQAAFTAPTKIDRPQFDKSKVELVEVPPVISAGLEAYPRYEAPQEAELSEFSCPDWEEFAPAAPKLPAAPSPPEERAIEPKLPEDLPAPKKGTFQALPVGWGQWMPPPPPAGAGRGAGGDAPDAELEPLPEFEPPEPRPRFVFDWSLLDRDDLLDAGPGVLGTMGAMGAGAGAGDGGTGGDGKVPKLDLAGVAGGGGDGGRPMGAGWAGGLIASGCAHLNFDAPYEDPPPLVPPRDQMETVKTARAGPEPMLKTPRRADMPVLEKIEPERAPVFIPPMKKPLPEWVAPSEPRPMGFIRGLRPVLVLDVSGTMSDRLPDEPCSRQQDLKECVLSLLRYDPPSVGQLATTCLAFDLIAYSWRAWSWASELEQRARIRIRDATPLSGRQAGGKVQPRPASAPASVREDGRGCCTPTMMPTEPTWLDLAAAWVARWQKAQGKTNCLGGLQKALDQPDADSIYLFSDGLADNRYQVIKLLNGLKALEKVKGHPVPPIHTVAIQAPTSGDRFLRQVAEITGGTYYEYDPVRKDLAEGPKLTPEQRVEREWAEAQVALKLRANHKAGVKQSVQEIIEEVRLRHDAERVEPAREAQDRTLFDAKMSHDAECERVERRNKAREREAARDLERRITDWRHKEQENLRRAREEHELSMSKWKAKRLESEAEADAKRALLEVARGELLASIKHDPRILQEIDGRNSRAMERCHTKHKFAVEETKKRNEELEAAAAAHKDALMRRRAKAQAIEEHHNAEIVRSLIQHCINKVAIPSVENDRRAAEVQKNFEGAVVDWRAANQQLRDDYRVAYAKYEQIRMQWTRYRQEKAMHAAEVASLEAEYERAVADAKAKHAPIRAAALVAYEKAAEEREVRLYKAREAAETEYRAKVAEIDERNRRGKAAAEKRRRERAEAEEENKNRIKSARSRWRWNVAMTAYRNQARKADAKRQYLMRMAMAVEAAEREHKANVAQWEEEVRKVRATNEAAVKAEAATHRAAVQRLQEEHMGVVAEARKAWEEATVEAERHREEVYPKVLLARKVGGELDKVERFLRRIRDNAGECWDRVVEMSTIILALDEAFLGEDIPWDLSIWPNIPPSAMQALRERLMREEAESVRRLSPPRSRPASPPSRGPASVRASTPGGWSARTMGDVPARPGTSQGERARPSSRGAVRPKSARPRLQSQEYSEYKPYASTPLPSVGGASPAPSSWAWGSPRTEPKQPGKRPSSAKARVTSAPRPGLSSRPARERLQLHHMLPPHMIRVRPILNQMQEYRALG